jgi:hypothetical protein
LVHHGAVHDVVDRQRSPKALEGELARRLDRHRILDGQQDARLIRICPGCASSHSREAIFDTMPIAA